MLQPPRSATGHVRVAKVASHLRGPPDLASRSYPLAGISTLAAIWCLRAGLDTGYFPIVWLRFLQRRRKHETRQSLKLERLKPRHISAQWLRMLLLRVADELDRRDGQLTGFNRRAGFSSASTLIHFRVAPSR